MNYVVYLRPFTLGVVTRGLMLCLVVTVTIAIVKDILEHHHFNLYITSGDDKINEIKSNNHPLNLFTQFYKY